MSKIVWLNLGQFTVVDDEDYARFGHLRWWCAFSCNTGYVMVNQDRTVTLHRLIVNAPEDFQVDHIDGDGFNNRRYNLRVCTRSQNQHNTGLRKDNTSGYKGVSKEKKGRLWEANIKINGRQKKIGRFATAEEAWLARCKVAAELHGEYARSIDW